MEHFGDDEREVRYDDDDERLHDAVVGGETGREGAGEAHQRPDAERTGDDDEERDDAEHDVDGDHVLASDLAQLAEDVVQNLRATIRRA